MSTVAALDVVDVRFPTSRHLDGSDAMNPDPDYSAAYVVLRTTEGPDGHGSAFTIGRGNDVEVAAIRALAPFVVGRDVEELCADLGGFSAAMTTDSQLRWLGPEKGVMHMAIGAVVNAAWDLAAKRAGLPLWALLARMSPAEIVALVVSQTPIRESLARLEADGLVVKQAFRGYSTTPLLTRSELDDLYAFRLLIEPWAAARAAERAGRPTRDRLRAEMDSCASAPDRSDYETYRTRAGHDARFHSLIAELSGNAPLQTAFERSHCHLHVFRLYYDRQLGSQALPEHRRVVRAINSGDAAAAEAAMREHLERSLARLRPVAEAT